MEVRRSFRKNEDAVASECGPHRAAQSNVAAMQKAAAEQNATERVTTKAKPANYLLPMRAAVPLSL